MSDFSDKLREEFISDKEYAHAYMESQIDAFIATQLKVLRDKAEWSQEQLAAEAGMKQERISVLEDVNYSSWTVNTLRKIARAFDLVLKVSFEEFGTVIREIEEFSSERLLRRKREMDLRSFRAEEPIPTNIPTEIMAQTAAAYILDKRSTPNDTDVTEATNLFLYAGSETPR